MIAKLPCSWFCLKDALCIMSQGFVRARTCFFATILKSSALSYGRLLPMKARKTDLMGCYSFFLRSVGVFFPQTKNLQRGCLDLQITQFDLVVMDVFVSQVGLPRRPDSITNARSLQVGFVLVAFDVLLSIEWLFYIWRLTFSLAHVLQSSALINHWSESK